MRVAYVCADAGVPVFGHKGASIHVQEVVRALIGRGATVDLFATRCGGDPPSDLAAVPCFALPAPSRSDAAEREAAASAANGALRSLLEAGQPFDLIYERYSLWSHAGIVWARDRGIPAIVEVNAPLIEEQAEHRNLVDRSGAEASARTLFAAADAVVAVSTGVVDWLNRFGVDRDKIHVVPNGVDTRRFAPIQRETDDESFTAGFVGTLKPWHGLDTLVEAAALARGRGCPLRLLIVGEGPERGALEARLAAAGLADHAELTGSVAPGRIPALLARMDVALAPYPALTDFYFSPLKIMEYMAAGRAIVASRIGDIDGLIENGETGLLCPPGDAGAFANALVRLHRESDLRTSLGKAARALAERELGWDRVAATILALAGRAAARPEPRMVPTC